MFKYLILILILLLLYPLQIIAQDKASSLIERMDNAKGIEKIDLLNEISVAYRKTDRYKSMDYAHQAYTLSVENNYLPGIALSKKNEGICWFFMGNNDSANLCYLQALENFSKVGDKMGVSACYNNLGLIAQETGKYDVALKYYKQSIEIDQKLGDEIGVVSTKANIVDILIYQGNSKKALLLINEVLTIYQRKSDKEGVMRTLINRASIYDNLKRFDDALADQKEAIMMAKALKDKYVEGVALSNFGLVTWHKGNPDEAMRILNQVLALSDGDDDGYDILNTLWIMSEIYTSKKEYVLSNEILQKVLKKYEIMDNKREEAKVLTSLGRNLIELNEIDKALGYLSKSLEITARINAPYEMLENYRNLAHAYAILHNFSAADSLQDLFAETYSGLFNSDSITDAKNEKKVNSIEITSSDSTITDWIIAFSLMFLVFIFSIITFRKNKLEI